MDVGIHEPRGEDPSAGVKRLTPDPFPGGLQVPAGFTQAIRPDLIQISRVAVDTLGVGREDPGRR